MPKQKAISFRCRDNFPCAFLDLAGSKRSMNRLIDKNKVVIANAEIRLKISVPVEKSFVVKARSPSSGWTRKQLVKQIAAYYQLMYSSKSSRKAFKIYFDDLKQLQLYNVYKIKNCLYGIDIEY